MAITVAEMIVRARADTSDLESGLKRSEQQVKSFGKSIDSSLKMGAGFAAGLAGISTAQAALGKAFQTTIGTAAGYERQLNVLQATSGATDAQLKQISRTAVALGNDTTLAGVSATQAATAMLELSKAGLSVADTQNAAKGVLQLATAGQLAHAQAAEITANALNAFGLEGSEASRVADLLAAAANASSADVGELGQGMAQASAIFKNANQPVEALITSMALMANAGIKGSDGATSLKTAVQRLAAPTGEAAAEMKKYDISVRDASGQMRPMRKLVGELSSKLGGLNAAQRDAALATIFGSDAIRAAQIVLTAGVESYDKMATAVTKSGAANDLASAQMKGLAGSVGVLQSQLETMALSAGQKVTPTLTGMVQGVTAALNSDFAATFLTGLDTIGEGVAGLVDLFLALPMPIQVATAAATAFLLTLRLIAANPYAVIFATGATAAVLLAAKIREVVDEQYQLDAATKAYAATVGTLTQQAAPLYAAKLKEIEAAGGSLAGKLAYLRAEHEQLGIAGDQVYAKLVKLAEPFQGNQELAAKNSAEFARLQNQWLSNQAGMTELEKQAASLGFGLERLRDGSTQLNGEMSKVPGGTRAVAAAALEAEPPLSALARAFGITNEEAKKLKDPLAEAAGHIDTLTGAATRAETTWNRQTTALDAVASSSRAMTSALHPEQLQQWAARAHEMADQSGAAAPQVAELHRNIDLVAKGGPVGAAALERINKIVEQAKKPYEDASAASRDYAEAQGAAAKEALGIGGALEDLKGILASFVDAFKVAMGQVPDSAKGAMELTKEAVTVDLGKPGAESALSWAGGFDGNRTVIIRAASSAATEAQQELAFDASAYGSNVAASFAAGMEHGISRVRVAAAMLASAAKDTTEQYLQTGSPSKVFIQYGEWTGEGFAIGLSNAEGDVIRAMTSLTEGGLTILEEAVGLISSRFAESGEYTADYAHDLENLGAVFDGLAGGAVGVLAEDISLLTDVVVAADGELHTLITSLRQANIDALNLDLAIARLNRELSYTDPYSERAAAIKQEIQLYEGWKGQIQSGIAVLQAEAAALEASKTALDGAREARAKFQQEQALLAQVGEGGGNVITAMLTAFTENSAETGRLAYEQLEASIATLEETMGPRAQEAGNYLRFLFWEAFNAQDPLQREAALARMGEFFAEQQELNRQAGTLSAQSYAGAYTEALAASNLEEAVGSSMAAFFDQLTRTVTEGGAANITRVAEMVVGIEQEIARLPEEISGPLMAEWKRAWDAFLAAPGDPASMAKLQEVARRIHQATEVIPRDLASLAPQMREAAIRLWQEVDAGTITLKQAQERWSAILKLIPQDMAAMSPVLQAEIYAIVQAFLTMGMSAEQAAILIEQAMGRAAAAAGAARASIAGAAAGVMGSGAGGGGGGGSGLEHIVWNGMYGWPSANFPKAPTWDPVADPHGTIYAAALAAWYEQYGKYGGHLGNSAIVQTGIGMASGGFVRESARGTIVRMAELGTGGEWTLKNGQLGAIVSSAVETVARPLAAAQAAIVEQTSTVAANTGAALRALSSIDDKLAAIEGDSRVQAARAALLAQMAGNPMRTDRSPRAYSGDPGDPDNPAAAAKIGGPRSQFAKDLVIARYKKYFPVYQAVGNDGGTSAPIVVNLNVYGLTVAEAAGEIAGAVGEMLGRSVEIRTGTRG